MILTDNIRIHRVVTGTWKNLFFSVLTCFAAYFINELWLSNYFSFPAFVPTILGTALAFFIGFNNNQAYDRWWEARKIWGSIVNNSRTWARQVLTYTSPATGTAADELSEVRTRLVRRHIAFLYALKAYLRRSEDLSDMEQYLQPEDRADISGQGNLHNALLSLQSRDLDLLYRHGAVDGFRFIEHNRMITALCDDMGKSERIRNTVFPTTYNSYAKGFIWFFVYSVTMTIGSSIGIWSIIFGTLTGYVFFTIQAIGSSLLDPFEADNPTGIPLDQITRSIEINLLEMLGETDIPPPVESVRGEYVM